MCNFVPGEAIVLGQLSDLHEIGPGLPGTLVVQPLITEVGDLDANNPFIGIGTAVLKTEPGLEIYAVSQISARLADQIRYGKAYVDLNHFVPMAAYPADLDQLRFTPPAEAVALQLRRFLRSALAQGSVQYRVSILDSGIDPDFIQNRRIIYYDYSNGGRYNPGQRPQDPLGHGTRVAKILDEILPPQVELVVGRLPSDSVFMTTLVVANAFGDMIARSTPDVVNLSIAPRDNVFFCKKCKERVNVPAFLPTFLPHLIRLAGRGAKRTSTVMASGNTGQVANSRWINEDIETLVFAVAENRHGNRARYSGAPEGPNADLFSASIFGGDDPDEVGSMGVFIDGSHGTSYAAPFLSSIALIAKDLHAPVTSGYPVQLGVHMRRLIEGARNGWTLSLNQAAADDEAR